MKFSFPACLLLCASLVFSFAPRVTVQAAQNNKQTGAHLSNARSMQKIHKTTSKAVKSPAMYLGTIVGIVEADRVVNVKLSTGATWTVIYTPRTKLTRGTKTIMPSDLAVGDIVLVHGGKNIQRYTIAATTIAVQSPRSSPVETPVKE